MSDGRTSGFAAPASNRIAVLGLAAGLLASGCVSLDPHYRQPPLPVPDRWPTVPAATTAVAVPAAAAGTALPGDTMSGEVAEIGWRDFFVDPKLQQLIELALRNNRDLRVAVLNVERARAQYRVTRADRLPSVDASGGLTKEKQPLSVFGLGGGSTTIQYYSAQVGVSAFELDLFGRVRSLSRAALEQYFTEEQAQRSAQLTLIAEIANAYLTLGSDRELKRLAEETLKSQEDSFQLTQRRYDRGAVSGLDLAQAQTTVESARADAARYDGNVNADLDALTLLVGAMPDAALLPDSIGAQVTGLAALPSGLPSTVLLRRPDVLQAEHTLRAANANIGAARAAFFPSITLTGSVGSISSDLSGMFKSGTGTWSFTPQLTLPIFEGGRLRGNLDIAAANRDIALAQYEHAIQSGFREVADALSFTQTLARQRQAQEALVAAAGRAYELSQQRYRAGRDSYLNLLDAQRTNYAAQQGLISTRLAEQDNRITLYKVLGGGWREHGP